MSRLKRGWVGALVVLGGVFAAGCGPSTWWHLLKGEQEMKADHPFTPPTGKKEVTVAVCVTSAPGVPDGSGSALDLAGKIGGQFKSVAELNKDTPVVVIDQNKVQKLRMNDTAWQTGNGGEFAKKVGADYWVDVTVQSLTFMDRDYGGEVCRGKAELEVAVYEAGNAEPKYTYHHSSVAQLKPSDPQQMSAYSNQYLGHVATELAFKHVKYKMDQKRAMEK